MSAEDGRRPVVARMTQHSAEQDRPLINARALFAPDWGKPCDCGLAGSEWADGCDCEEREWLHLMTAPDGREYVVPFHSWIMLRRDRLNLAGVKPWGEADDSTWGYLSDSNQKPPDRIVRLLMQTTPSASRSDCRFREWAVETLYAAGASIWPCDLVLDHAPMPPHVVMFGEDLIGWIMPLKDAEHGVTLPDPRRRSYAMSLSTPPGSVES